MATTTRPVSKRFTDPRGWAALCAVLLVALGASVLALIAQHSANNAVDCVNNVLGARSDLTVQSAEAQKTFADADKAYNAAVNEIIRSAGRSTPAQSAALRARFAAASATKAAASDAYSMAMRHVLTVATANPLGRC